MPSLKRFSVCLAVSACALLAVTGCSQENQNDVLAGFGLKMPPCEREDQTFSGTTDYPNS